MFFHPKYVKDAIPAGTPLWEFTTLLQTSSGLGREDPSSPHPTQRLPRFDPIPLKPGAPPLF